ncbi:hypothetical protein CBM2605_A120031 [Cupriavidus neocaledonicus]|uniref:Uncharacterized protein n=1 Tax=Cupriavidus neocaledonicus TaxID=1040979 RepID=A0ABY1UWH9_9BURK|nr:hypothetical protein CBM2605_A120031 [Cupriavidus neocaledonicus]
MGGGPHRRAHAVLRQRPQRGAGRHRRPVAGRDPGARLEKGRARRLCRGADRAHDRRPHPRPAGRASRARGAPAGSRQRAAGLDCHGARGGGTRCRRRRTGVRRGAARRPQADRRIALPGPGSGMRLVCHLRAPAEPMTYDDGRLPGVPSCSRPPAIPASLCSPLPWRPWPRSACAARPTMPG